MIGRAISVGGRGRVHRGAAIVELAIVLPVLLLIVFGIIEFGQVMFVRQTLIAAATEGAREGTLPGATQALVLQRVQQVLDDGGLASYDVAVVYASGASPDLSETVSVSVAYSEVSLLGGFFDEFLLRSSCTMFRGPFD